MRACRYKHSTPSETAATCRLCWLAVNDSRYAKLWGEGEPIPTGDVIGRKVSYCKARKCWDWAVTQNGRTLASGSEGTREEADREVAAFITVAPTDTATRPTSAPSTPHR